MGGLGAAISNIRLPQLRTPTQSDSLLCDGTGASKESYSALAKLPESDKEMWLTCMICDSDFDSFQHLYAFGKCDHVVCSVCILLERTRKKSNNCALCRNEMQDVVVTSTPCLTYSDFDGKTLKTAKKGNSGGLADICYNHGIFFPKDYYDAVVTKLLSQYCHVCSRSDFRDFDALQEHYNNAHKGLSRCKVCNDYQLTLPYCMEVYTCNQLDAHMRAEVSAGDGVESIGIGGGHRGHPKCGYCVDLYFYDDGGLAEHINKNHFLCENCTHSDPKKMMHYLPDRDAWMAHNRDRHFVCEHQQCQQSQCVFYTLSDFQSHNNSLHRGEVISGGGGGSLWDQSRNTASAAIKPATFGYSMAPTPLDLPTLESLSSSSSSSSSAAFAPAQAPASVPSSLEGAMDDSEGRLSLIGASIEPQPDQHQPTSDSSRLAGILAALDISKSDVSSAEPSPHL